MIERVTCEGFIEGGVNTDGTFNLVMVKPIFQLAHPLTTAGIDEMVEDVWIDLVCQKKLEDLNDNSLNNSTTVAEFKRCQSEPVDGIVYWKRTFEWNPDDHDHFEIVERAGA